LKEPLWWLLRDIPLDQELPPERVALRISGEGQGYFWLRTLSPPREEFTFTKATVLQTALTEVSRRTTVDLHRACVFRESIRSVGFCIKTLRSTDQRELEGIFNHYDIPIDIWIGDISKG
jgi:hypothetical protein